MSCTDILAHCDCKKCISICICSCRSIVSSVSAPIKIFVCFKKKCKKKDNELRVKVAPYSFFVLARADFENLVMAQAFKLHAKVAREIKQ